MSCFVNKYTDCLIGIIIFNTTVYSTNTGTCFFRKETKKETLTKKLKMFFIIQFSINTFKKICDMKGINLYVIKIKRQAYKI